MELHDQHHVHSARMVLVTSELLFGFFSEPSLEAGASVHRLQFCIQAWYGGEWHCRTVNSSLSRQTRKAQHWPRCGAGRVLDSELLDDFIWRPSAAPNVHVSSFTMHLRATLFRREEESVTASWLENA